MTIITAIIILAILILVHEAGHFWVARRIGIPVYEFSLGFGKKLYSTRKDGVEYSLRLIPLGGFVRMAGEEQGDMSNPEGFNNRKPWEKIAVSFSGPFMNFVLAIFIFIYTFAFIGLGFPSNEPVVGEVIKGKPAYAAGLQSNDRILSMNGQEIHSWEEFVQNIQAHPAGSSLATEVERGGTIQTITVVSTLDKSSGNPIVGVYPQLNFVRQGIIESVRLGFVQTYQMTLALLGGLGMLFSGAASSSDLAGPVGITSMVGEAARGGLVYLLSFTAFLSINLGVINLLPIPALDGSKIVFAVIEKIRRRPMDPEKEGFINWLGFMFLMLVIIFATYNDIVRLIKG
ncbi:MAG: RIP metalloprotease RseP [Syntrophomonadaceae bacterium]